MNKIIVCGNITKDIEISYTGQGLAIATFSIAINEGKDKTTFLNLKAFGKTAETISTYLGKGRKFLGEGHIQNNNFEKDGKKIYKDEYVIDRFTFVDKVKDKVQGKAQGKFPEFPDEDFFEATDDEVPF